MTDSGVRHRFDHVGSDGRYLIVPMDHGITQGPRQGLVDIESTVEAVTNGGADAVVTHRGLAGRIIPNLGESGYIVHLNASTTRGPDPNDKRQVCSVESAIAAGADAVSFHINIGSRMEADQLVTLGDVIETAHRYGLPVLAMSYPRGPDIDSNDPAAVAHAVRVASELGADIIKTSYPDTGFDQAVSATDAPVLIAGGEPDDDVATLEAIGRAMSVGAAGVSMGRTIFQHTDPRSMTDAVSAIVHRDESVEQARSYLA